MASFLRVWHAVNQEVTLFEGRILGLDPGETTGWCVFDVKNKMDDDGPPKLVAHGQITCDPIESGIDEITKLIDTYKPSFLVYEDYRVYGWLSDAHSWAALHTPKLIGTIVTLCHQHSIPNTKHMAVEAKGFCTDSKLREWGYYMKGMKHARDAVRHTLYYVLFTHKRELVRKAKASP